MVPGGDSLINFYMFLFPLCPQKDNVANQREHLILLLASAQSRLGTLDQSDEDKVLPLFL